MQHKKEYFIQICNSSSTMLSASKALNVSYTTFIRYAKKFGCYKPNMSGKGTSKPRAYVIPLTEILEGLHPTFQTFKLKIRLIKEGIFKNECHVCGLTEQNGKPLTMELHHKDGNSTNHRKENLQFICPNCHAQTPTYRGLNCTKY